MAFNPQLYCKPGHKTLSIITFNLIYFIFVFVLLSIIISIRTILYLSADITAVCAAEHSLVQNLVRQYSCCKLRLALENKTSHLTKSPGVQ